MCDSKIGTRFFRGAAPERMTHRRAVSGRWRTINIGEFSAVERRQMFLRAFVRTRARTCSGRLTATFACGRLGADYNINGPISDSIAPPQVLTA
jgi:hypothetical protein